MRHWAALDKWRIICSSQNSHSLLAQEESLLKKNKNIFTQNNYIIWVTEFPIAVVIKQNIYTYFAFRRCSTGLNRHLNNNIHMQQMKRGGGSTTCWGSATNDSLKGPRSIGSSNRLNKQSLRRRQCPLHNAPGSFFSADMTLLNTEWL